MLLHCVHLSQLQTLSLLSQLHFIPLVVVIKVFRFFVQLYLLPAIGFQSPNCLLGVVEVAHHFGKIHFLALFLLPWLLHRLIVRAVAFFLMPYLCFLYTRLLCILMGDDIWSRNWLPPILLYLYFEITRHDYLRLLLYLP